MRAPAIAAPFGETVASQLHESISERPLAGSSARASTLEQADRDEIGRDRVRDFRGERLNPRGDLHRSEQMRIPSIAGTDCGLGTRAGHPSICWAKFEALAEGARRATKILWGRG